MNPDWSLAGCVGDPEAMFEESADAVRFNRRVCAACPIVVDCGLWALEHAEPWGMWGGMTPAERERILEAPSRRLVQDFQRALKPCGTPAAARRHQRRGEQLCGPCSQAAAEVQRSRRAADPATFDAKRNARRQRPVAA